MANQILLVEDESNLGSTLSETLIGQGHAVKWAQAQKLSLELLKQNRFDLVILDVGLPDGSGFEVAKWIRDHQIRVAILFLTAYDTPEDRIQGLELGAEDYVGKPFHLKELLLRVQNCLKRAQWILTNASGIPDPIQIGKASVSFSAFSAQSNGTTHPMTHKECALLRLLIERRGKVVSRDEILNAVWGENEFPTARTVDNFIVRLRKIVEQDPDHPEVIKSVRGVGYQLNA